MSALVTRVAETVLRMRQQPADPRRRLLMRRDGERA
jgi:hypothetical protein